FPHAANTQGAAKFSVGLFPGPPQKNRHRLLDRRSGSAAGVAFDLPVREKIMPGPIQVCSPSTSLTYDKYALTDMSTLQAVYHPVRGGTRRERFARHTGGGAIM